MRKLLPCLALISVLTGCATISEGTKATVAIDTPGVSGAACSVANQAGKIQASTRSPGTVTLPKGRADLIVTCTRDGYRTGTAQLSSSMADRAKLQMPSGYLLDAASGAMWTYPPSVTVEMARN